MYAVLLYIAVIVGANIGFSFIPMVDLGFGLFSPTAVVVGTVFVLRDYAQRSVGHWVLLAMLIGTGLSYLMADPFVATASALAFATSELADYLLYSMTKKKFHERVMISSLLSTPIDTAVFLFMITQFTLGTFLIMIGSKMIAATAIYFIGVLQEPQEISQQVE